MCVRHAGPVTNNPCDVDLAAVGGLFGDPARAAMLVALSDGRALPAGELARRVSVSPATATTHLRRLVEGGLVQGTVQGRHRYHQLAGPQVSAVLEALAHVAPASPVKSLRQHRDLTTLAEARTCYDHLAGRRGVQLRDRLLAAGALQTTDGPTAPCPSSKAPTCWPPEHCRPLTGEITGSLPAANQLSPAWTLTSTNCAPGGGSLLDRVWTGPSAVPIWPVPFRLR